MGKAIEGIVARSPPYCAIPSNSLRKLEHSRQRKRSHFVKSIRVSSDSFASLVRIDLSSRLQSATPSFQHNGAAPAWQDNALLPQRDRPRITPARHAAGRPRGNAL